MKHLWPVLLMGVTAAVWSCAPAAPPATTPDAAARATNGIEYPEVPTVDVVDVYHGVEIADPYRWLEDTEAPETRAWIEAQNEITFPYLRSLPGREPMRARLTELWDYERYGTPFKEGGRYFYFRNDGLQDHSVLYWTPELEAEPRVLIDPNTLSDDGTVSLATVAISDDGRHMVWGTSEGGSDWRELRVREVETGRDLPDHLRWIKFSGASWTKDGEGFFYSRYPTPEGDPLLAENVDHKLYYHRIGTDQSQDVLVHERPDRPRWNIGGRVTDDGRYLIIHLSEGTDRRNRVHYMDLVDPQSPRMDGEVVRLLDDFDASYSFIDNDGPVFYFTTDLDAPRSRVIAIDTRSPEPSAWRTVVPESDDVLRGASFVGDHLAGYYLRNAHSRIALFTPGGQYVREMEMPTLGTVGGLSGDRGDPEVFYAFTSYLYPTTIFRHDLESGETEVFRTPDIDFDPARFETRQVWYRSADGTRVPMFITHRRGMDLDGENPTLLYGYGGFNISLTPSFSVSNLAWLERGGVYAVANLRGGGEFGEEWHRAGRTDRKQNVFDDFIAAGEYLVAEGYTRPERLGIAGGSNGGLLVGAVINQRPDLFGAALPAVGVMDMLRFHRFTIGWAWVSDYGSAEDPEMFPILHAYSPYHNIEEGTCYPPTLVTTGDHDDRVVPGHSFKYAAALQAAQGCANPTLIRIETRAGHGAGKPTWMVIEEQADRWAFLMHHLGLR